MIMTQDGGPHIYVTKGKLILEYTTHELHVDGALFVSYGIGMSNGTEEHLDWVGRVLHPLELPKVDKEQYFTSGQIIVRPRGHYKFGVDFVINNGRWIGDLL